LNEVWALAKLMTLADVAAGRFETRKMRASWSTKLGN
jgi:hypothetical protein